MSNLHNYYNKNNRKVRISLKIVIAPDSFKESMTAYEAAVAMENGVRRVVPDAEVYKVPIADGGEGTVQALIDTLGGEKIMTKITGPLGEPIDCHYGVLNNETAVIEVAAACGLDIIPTDKRNPMQTTSYGVGELIIHALDKGIRRFIIGLGGSGTNDGGIGMAQALGIRMTDKTGRAVRFGGEGLMTMHHISTEPMDSRIQECVFDIASDVTNPLLGKEGGTYIYGPQKGANDEMVLELDEAMAYYADIIERDVGVEITHKEGAGAAGGLGGACLAFLQATVHPGIEMVARLTGLADVVEGTQLVLTGDGKMDHQTSYGKAITGVAEIARYYDVPVVALTGANLVDDPTIYDHGIDAIFSLQNEPMSLAYAMENGIPLTERIAENVLRLFVRTFT